MPLRHLAQESAPERALDRRVTTREPGQILGPSGGGDVLDDFGNFGNFGKLLILGTYVALGQARRALGRALGQARAGLFAFW